MRDTAKRWATDASQQGTATRAHLCRDRDDPSAWEWIVEFPSYEAAMRNSQRPETDALFREFADLCSDEPAFRDLDVTETGEA